MAVQLVLFLAEAAASFLSFALLARFALQWARAPFRNPLGQFVIAVTDWAVRPARRVIPSAWGHDLPSLVLAWISQGMYLGLAYGLMGAFGEASVGVVGGIALLALIETGRIALHLAVGVVIVSALLSWVNPYAPLAPLFQVLSRPLLRPFQRFIPPIGGVDLSPVALILVLQMGQMVLSAARAWVFPVFFL